MESLCQFFNTLPLEIYQPVDSFYLPESIFPKKTLSFSLKETEPMYPLYVSVFIM